MTSSQTVETASDLPTFATQGTIYSVLDTRKFMKFNNGVWSELTADPTPAQVSDNFHTRLDPLTTTDNTPTNWFSIEVPQNTDIKLMLYFDCRKSDYSVSYGGYVIGKFIRGSGNVSSQGSPVYDTITGILGLKPVLTLSANTDMQTIDIIAKGLSGNFIWSGYFFLESN